jgi:hypothetical protein
MNPDNGSENASNFEDVKAVKVIDDTHVDIVLNAPNVAMPDYLTIGILPKHILEGQDMTTSSFNQNPIGAGPYKLVSWDMGQAIVMEKFDNYYQGSPNIDTVVFKIVEDTDARALQLESGEPLYKKVICEAMTWGSKDNTMFVVGATRPEKLAEIREYCPDHFFLVPGVGAQGGTVEEVAKYGLNSHCGLLVNSSRGIIFADSSENFAVVAGEKARELAEQMAPYV